MENLQQLMIPTSQLLWITSPPKTTSTSNVRGDTDRKSSVMVSTQQPPPSTGQQCYVKALESDPTDSHAWYLLSTVLQPTDKVKVGGETYTGPIEPSLVYWVDIFARMPSIEGG